MLFPNNFCFADKVSRKKGRKAGKKRRGKKVENANSLGGPHVSTGGLRQKNWSPCSSWGAGPRPIQAGWAAMRENPAARRERTARLGWTWVDLAGYQTSCQNAGELHAACPRPGDEQRGRDRERKEGRYIQSDRPHDRPGGALARRACACCASRKENEK